MHRTSSPDGKTRKKKSPAHADVKTRKRSKSPANIRKSDDVQRFIFTPPIEPNAQEVKDAKVKKICREAKINKLCRYCYMPFDEEESVTLQCGVCRAPRKPYGSITGIDIIKGFENNLVTQLLKCTPLPDVLAAIVCEFFLYSQKKPTLSHFTLETEEKSKQFLVFRRDDTFGVSSEPWSLCSIGIPNTPYVMLLHTNQYGGDDRVGSLNIQDSGDSFSLIKDDHWINVEKLDNFSPIEYEDLSSSNMFLLCPEVHGKVSIQTIYGQYVALSSGDSSEVSLSLYYKLQPDEKDKSYQIIFSLNPVEFDLYRFRCECESTGTSYTCRDTLCPNYCLHEASLVLLADGALCPAKRLAVGDRVLAVERDASTGQFVLAEDFIEARVTSYRAVAGVPYSMVQLPNGALLTSGHPVLTCRHQAMSLSLTFASGRLQHSQKIPQMINWVQPRKVWPEAVQAVDTRAVYNFVLTGRRALLVGGIDNSCNYSSGSPRACEVAHVCSTLGQFCEDVDDVNSFFGTDRVVHALKRRVDYPDVSLWEGELQNTV
jgi:hypothetical protein